MEKLNLIRERCSLEGWDGPYSLPIPPFVLDVASRVVPNVENPFVGPSTTGEIDIVWAPYNGNPIEGLLERSLFVCIGEVDFDVTVGVDPVVPIDFEDPKDAQRCADQVLKEIQTVLFEGENAKRSFS